jgi:hypothetical protein
VAIRRHAIPAPIRHEERASAHAPRRVWDPTRDGGDSYLPVGAGPRVTLCRFRFLFTDLALHGTFTVSVKYCEKTGVLGDPIRHAPP